jgi:cardiolipin synthase
VKPLVGAIAGIALEVHPGVIDALCASLKTATDRTDVFAVLRLHLGRSIPSSELDRLIGTMEAQADFCAEEISAMFYTAAATASLMRSASAVELVWTGPDTTIVPTRHTEQVLISVIDEAVATLFIVSFVAYQVPNVIAALRRAGERGILVKALLEPSEYLGGKIAFDSTSAIRAVLPNGQFYAWQKKTESSGGCVHAKCVVADSKCAFITSANLTGAAMEKNIEVGVLVRGGILPAQLEEQLNALIETKHLRLV